MRIWMEQKRTVSVLPDILHSGQTLPFTLSSKWSPNVLISFLSPLENLALLRAFNFSFAIHLFNMIANIRGYCIQGGLWGKKLEEFSYLFQYLNYFYFCILFLSDLFWFWFPIQFCACLFGDPSLLFVYLIITTLAFSRATPSASHKLVILPSLGQVEDLRNTTHSFPFLTSLSR